MSTHDTDFALQWVTKGRERTKCSLYKCSILMDIKTLYVSHTQCSEKQNKLLLNGMDTGQYSEVSKYIFCMFLSHVELKFLWHLFIMSFECPVLIKVQCFVQLCGQWTSNIHCNWHWQILNCISTSTSNVSAFQAIFKENTANLVVVIWADTNSR